MPLVFFAKTEPITLKVLPPVKSSVLKNKTICPEDKTTLDAGSGFDGYEWSTGATTQSINAGPGTYIVTVNDGSCTATDTVVVNNNNTVTAAFTAPAGCAGSAVQFTNQSTTTAGTLVSYAWNFGGLGSSTLQNPSFTFPAAGSYTVSLVATASNGCSDTVANTITVNTPPVAQFTAGTACAGGTIAINNTSSPVAGSIWAWNFGNGTTSTLQNPSVTYSTAGSYNVSLLVTASNGCTAIANVPVTINPLPVASFNAPATVCQGSVTPLINTSGPGLGTITSYAWNFGNGQTSVASNPTVTYTNPGNYTITLTITNSFGCTATATRSIAVNPTPIASAGERSAFARSGRRVLQRVFLESTIIVHYLVKW